MSKRFPGRKLSLYRLILLVAAVVALIYGGVSSVWSWQDTQAAKSSMPWFGAYVDVTAVPTQVFESPTNESEKNVVLGFIVASNPEECEATWGGYYTLDEASTALDLDRRILRLRQFGGQAVVSFGGQANAELALACDSSEKLLVQYRAVLDRYDPTAIDLDIEGPALTDVESRQRRAEVIAQLLEERKQPLPVWLTLPAGPDGLTADGVAVVQEFLDAGVDIAGVNAMTMNFTGPSAEEGLAEVAIESLRETHRQLRAVYADRDESMGDRAVWRKVGATPMIGQNDVVSEVFRLEDARKVNAFASEVGLGRMSMWSANRDRNCADAYVDLSVVSDSCSGIIQGDQAFGGILSAAFYGTPSGSLEPASPGPNVRPESLVDDPETSPYPIWDPEAFYPMESRTVWRHNVYVAKWWNSGVQPDDPSIATADSPWRLVGPVLPGETPAPQLELPGDFYPEWDPAQQYERGQRVMLDGVAYEAKWWTQGADPSSGQADPGASPWQALAQDEIGRLLGAVK